MPRPGHYIQGVQTRCACCGYDCYQTGRCPCCRADEGVYAGSPGRTSGHGSGASDSGSRVQVHDPGPILRRTAATSPHTVTCSSSMPPLYAPT
jgi:hypothetical protein